MGLAVPERRSCAVVPGLYAGVFHGAAWHTSPGIPAVLCSASGPEPATALARSTAPYVVAARDPVGHLRPDLLHASSSRALYTAPANSLALRLMRMSRARKPRTRSGPK